MTTKNDHAVALGRMGGLVKSKKKRLAILQNLAKANLARRKKILEKSQLSDSQGN